MKTNKTRSALGAVLVVGSIGGIVALTISGTGCAQLLGPSASSASTQQNSATLMGQSLEIAAPDGSYLAQSTSQIAPSGSHVQALLTTIINPIAGPLRESSSHLIQTVSTGQSGSNSLTFSVSSLGTSLVGTANTASGSVSYVYTINGQPYFTGSTATLGATGNFTFSTAPAINVSYSLANDTSGNLVTTTTVSTASGTLTFAATSPNTTAPPVSITMSGSVSGTKVSGAWNTSTGGYFVDLSGTKECFSATLVDTFGC